MKFYLLILFVLVGCNNVSEYKRTGTRVMIVPANSGIGLAEVSDWKVGPRRKQRVSKGIRVKVNLPQLDKSDMKDMADTLDVDSWLIRVRRRTLVTNNTLEYIYVPFLVPGRGRSNLRIKQVAAAFINIYYSAAAISARFETFQCPAFDHRTEIVDHEIVQLHGTGKIIKGNKKHTRSLNQKLSPYAYKPLPVNAGKEMNGEYRFEIALFNIKNKEIKSDWFDIGQSVKVTKERVVKLTGCLNFKIPDVDSKKDDVNSFKFGR